jgi:hypothetical protein
MTTTAELASFIGLSLFLVVFLYDEPAARSINHRQHAASALGGLGIDLPNAA